MNCTRYTVLLLAVTALGCAKEQKLVEVPAHFPELPVPADNSITQEKIELGRALFYEEALSKDSSVSCASCHLQSLAFSDGKKVSIGVHGATGQRNSPALQNLAYYPGFFMDGGIPTLEMQVEAPIFTEEEMAFSYFEASKRLNADEHYLALFQAAFGKEADAYGITRSIAAFERTMISGNSKYDQFENGKATLTENEQKGMDLFFSEKTGCSDCHSGFLFTDFSMINVGLYENYVDTGYARITQKSSDAGKFRVSSLRNVALTAPYFHDGSVETLEEVIDHFNSGGKAHSNKDRRIRPLDLSGKERSDLIAFLHTLTDESFIKDPRFSDPKLAD
ncbi:MAG: cytochrome c peroxidase [Granulosicoccus sp.]|jgi:cytochrome c peroxidase